ncbi:unnamed protein product [Adineta ricciae]|uniref:Endonuclease/exonuclease/phosphatase domain-containing protein n=1 Tax=Adineta ricciae TaxID=249248 RepID=A0A815L5W2_ADIRI|nr:unnamed protein product [Adineta ricciae]CAF1445224.1 unnamed protein product [Adineta ricciae]
MDSIPNHDVKLLIGDMNAQINNSRHGMEHVIGPHATARKTNGNGERLILFCSMNNLCIGNTYFAHKNIHKKTWRSTIQDVRAYRGADVGPDHHLVRASLKLRFKRNQQRQTVKSYAIEKLKDSHTLIQYQITIKNRFEQLQYITDVDKHWTKFKHAVAESAEKTIGRRRGTQKERWIRDNTWQLIDERKMAKIQRDQAKTTDEQQIVTAKELTGSRSNCNVPIKGKNGKILLTKEEQDARWIQHFQESINQPNPTTIFDFANFLNADNIEANLGTITEAETRKAIAMLKNNKAPGVD